jgi:hypothetical protein
MTVGSARCGGEVATDLCVRRHVQGGRAMREEGVRGDKIMLGRGGLHRLALALVGLIFVQLDLTCKGFFAYFFLLLFYFLFSENIRRRGEEEEGLHMCESCVANRGATRG